jgi:hypothetical protein
MGSPVTVLATYRPKKGKEARFFTLLKQNWPTLKKAGLVAPTLPRLWRTSDKRTRRVYSVEMFELKNAKASDTAHRTPEVMAHRG